MIRHSQGKAKTEQQTEAEKQTMEKMKNVMTEFLKFRVDYKKSTKTLDEMFTYSLQMMTLSLDSPTIFNFRKDVILYKFEELKKNNENSSPEILETISKLVFSELKELFKMAMSDPKSYEIWFHRIWIIKQFSTIEKQLSPKFEIGRKIIQEDLQICEKYLKKDERNFHVWNYRLELNKLLIEIDPSTIEQAIEKELTFIMAKLDENSSNYSAIQFFTKYIEMKLDQQTSENQLKTYEDKIVPVIRSNTENLIISPNEQALWLFQEWIIYKLNQPALVFAEVKGKGEFILYFNRRIETQMLKKSLNLPVDFSITKIQSSIYKINVQEELLGEDSFFIEYRNNYKFVRLEIKENNFFVKEENQKIKFEECLKEIQNAFSEIDIQAIETLVFKPISIACISKELQLGCYFSDVGKLNLKLSKIVNEFIEILTPVAMTHYAKRLLNVFVEQKNTTFELFGQLSLL